MTPLICASKFDSYDACRLLIQNDAEITKKTCNGQSPMHYAARKGHTRVLEVSYFETNYFQQTKIRNVVNQDKIRDIFALE